MQQALDNVYAEFDETAPNLPAWGFVNCYDSGLRGGFKTVRQGGKFIATRDADGFFLELDLVAALTSNEGSATGCARFPYPGINSTTKFFLPRSAIRCKVRDPTSNELVDIECEGYMESVDVFGRVLTTIKMDCLDMRNHAYFWYAIGRSARTFC